MKIVDIALKDMTRSFRSAFAMIFMFVIPLLVPAMFYFMFGNIARTDQAFNLPVTKVIIVNLDQGSPEFQQAMANFPGGMQADSLGGLVVSVLESQDFANLIQVSRAADPETARAAVDNQKAGIAILLPADFSAQFSKLQGQAVIEFYQDPTLTIGPGIVKSILKQFMDSISGAKIAVNVTMAETGTTDYAIIGQVMQQYMAAQPQGDPTAALLDVRTPLQTEQPQSLMVRIIGPVMGAMMIFYAYYTGTATAQSILKEDEDHTLPRLFTTPTSHTTILTGKFLAVFLTVTVQVIILLIASRFIFAINWGRWEEVTLLVACIILSAATFGIFVNSLLKSTKQGGAIFGGVLTVTTMTGMMPVFVGFSGSTSSLMNTISLVVPQGWIVRMLQETMGNAPLNQILPTALVALAWSAVFFVIGIWRFQRRYA
jgi:ABC-2 type transport system permease protein